MNHNNCLHTRYTPKNYKRISLSLSLSLSLSPSLPLRPSYDPLDAPSRACLGRSVSGCFFSRGARFDYRPSGGGGASPSPPVHPPSAGQRRKWTISRCDDVRAVECQTKTFTANSCLGIKH